MTSYVFGILTLPLALLAGYLAVAAMSWTLSALGRLHLGILRRVRPENYEASRKRAAIIFGLRRGVVFGRGEFVLIFGYGLDDEKRRWAQTQLLRPLERAEWVRR